MLAILIDKYLLTDSRACKILLTAQVCLCIVIDHSRIGGCILRRNLLYIICIIGTVETLREFGSGKHTGYDVVRIFLQDHVRIGMYPRSHCPIRKPSPDAESNDKGNYQSQGYLMDKLHIIKEL